MASQRAPQRAHGLGLEIPRPPEGLDDPPLRTVSVTALRDYLACPYRFYLRHVLRLQSVDDSALELDAPSFGSVAHDVLRNFAEGEARASGDATEITAALLEHLERIAARRFGNRPLPAVKIQLAQLAERLTLFAEWQAAWRGQGWEIFGCEQELSGENCKVTVAGHEITLRGRIDRIDYNPLERCYAVIDYKLNELAADPRKAHEGRDNWRDLQLPLYCKLVRGTILPADAVVRTAYVSLPKTMEKVDAQWADWLDEEIESAWQTMTELLAKIVAKEFWPPASPYRGFDEYAILCGVGQRKG